MAAGGWPPFSRRVELRHARESPAGCTEESLVYVVGLEDLEKMIEKCRDLDRECSMLILY
ncbi:MAG: hypothetical protein F7B20_06055 [Aeropyrum sp.]|nr:hypothetical protein [Aeropyrum sp.]